MRIPQALPHRATDLVTGAAEALSAAQPERGREYVQLASGALDAVICERANGVVAALYERWGCALRVRCARPRSYVAFTAVLADTGANWCGLALSPGSLLEIDRDWELTTRGPFDSFSFAVDRASLERVEAQLAGGADRAAPRGNRALQSPAVARRVRRHVSDALASDALLPEARRALEADLLHLAARLRSFGARAEARPESPSRRRAAVRKVEEYLDLHDSHSASLAELCAIAGASERTLEYAFREQVGSTPGRYLRLRRLNGVRRDLLHVEAPAERVTDVAMRWGFWELGRFASEYRALFGECPSETLARAKGAPQASTAPR